MIIRSGFALMLVGMLACSGSGTDAAPTAQRSVSEDTGDAVSDTLPLEPAEYVVFVEPGTGFATDAVHDADREVVHLDTARGAMVSAETGATVSGWRVDGADLSWSRFGVPFRVRFGTEDGERRAYFTEAGPGTICNLRFSGDEQLSISGTSETPPNP
jgi:hypothetical protein